MKTTTLSYSDTSVLCLELALFLGAGADHSSAFTLLAEETEDAAMKERFLAVAHRIDEGMSLSAALGRSALVSEDVCVMLEVGERTGRTEETLRSLSRYYEQRDLSDRQIRSALLYPSILLMVMMTVIVVLLTKVLPIFSDVYASIGGQMTGIAGGLLMFGTLLNTLLPLLLVLLVLAAGALTAFACIPALRGRLTRSRNKRARRSGVAKKMRTARFAEALSMALSSGLVAEEAVGAASRLLADSDEDTGSCAACMELLAGGATLADAVRTTGLLPAAECRLLSLGFASGSGETAAVEIAKRLSRDADEALARRIGQIEPALVIVTSLLIGLILLTVMLPLTQIMTTIG